MKLTDGTTVRLATTRNGSLKITPIWNNRSTIKEPPRITKPKTPK
jgi:hypothetical protein